MAVFRTGLLVLATTVALGGCKKRYEGELPGDCSDGADNDRDGFFDCIDQSCATAPVCLNGLGVGGGKDDPDDPVDPTDTVVGLDTDLPDDDTDVVSDTYFGFVHDPLETVDLEFTISFDLDDLGDALCGLTTICDCSSSYTGTGVFRDGYGVRGTFEGTFELESTDCGQGFQDAVWQAPDGGRAFHTFRWNRDGSEMVQWIAHGGASDIRPLDPPRDNRQWWMDRMGASYNVAGKAFSHEETQTGQADLIMITNVFTLDAVFE